MVGNSGSGNCAVERRQNLMKEFQSFLECMDRPAPNQMMNNPCPDKAQIICMPKQDQGSSSSGNPKGLICPPEPPKKDSVRLIGGTFIESCQCTKRNGLQSDCPLPQCRGSPPCLVKPDADCIPGGGTGTKGYDKVKSYDDSNMTCYAVCDKLGDTCPFSRNYPKPVVAPPHVFSKLPQRLITCPDSGMGPNFYVAMMRPQDSVCPELSPMYQLCKK